TMKAKLCSIVLLLAPLAAGCSATKSQPSPELMAEKFTEFMTPGPAHKVLDAKVGRWSGNIKVWQGPDAPPSESTGTSAIQWILGGRYLEDRTEAQIEGAPFHGIGLTGYDNLKKKYVWTWIDDMGTGIVTGEGSYDEAGRTFTFTSQMPDPVQGKYVKSRSVETWANADHWTYEIYVTGADGREF